MLLFPFSKWKTQVGIQPRQWGRSVIAVNHPCPELHITFQGCTRLLFCISSIQPGTEKGMGFVDCPRTEQTQADSARVEAGVWGRLFDSAQYLRSGMLGRPWDLPAAAQSSQMTWDPGEDFPSLHRKGEENLGYSGARSGGV